MFKIFLNHLNKFTERHFLFVYSPERKIVLLTIKLPRSWNETLVAYLLNCGRYSITESVLYGIHLKLKLLNETKRFIRFCLNKDYGSFLNSH